MNMEVLGLPLKAWIIFQEILRINRTILGMGRYNMKTRVNIKLSNHWNNTSLVSTFQFLSSFSAIHFKDQFVDFVLITSRFSKALKNDLCYSLTITFTFSRRHIWVVCTTIAWIDLFLILNCPYQKLFNQLISMGHSRYKNLHFYVLYYIMYMFQS